MATKQNHPNNILCLLQEIVKHINKPQIDGLSEND